ncbi:MAG TPA: MobA/MobL family protein [Candidatus Blautia excrementipullorum]|uniref:MobQ family relaxase n=1 Tax=Lachnoclostridium sp. An169 TaxID=1965569 RepID=UPI000B38194A|nr:mobilization protein [Lachnoclostridium sp. An169]HJB17417.1 MobA/MobL family protein [Candidatus Blautia excrementipullorum]
MAIYHMSAKVVSRGAGRSAVAASAYLSCSRMYNDYDGVQHDYTRKQGLIFQEVLLPPKASPEWKDREQLWNAVERAEKTKDSRLAREFVVALPIELPRKAQISLLRDFIQNNFVDMGMCADFAIHDTDGHNPHAHILLTVRPLETDGTWQYKTQKEYLCIRNGEEKGFTASEFKDAQTKGWEKQYPYKVGKKKVYMAPSAAQEHGYIRADKHPKSTRFGRQNPVSEQWNSEAQLREWRKAWADAVNHTLQEHQIDTRIDHRSFADQGRDEQPTIHEGYHARDMEKKGLISDRCEINRQIRKDNRLFRELKRQVEKLTKTVSENIHSVAKRLEQLRGTMIMIRYYLFHNRMQASSTREWISMITPVLKKYKAITKTIRTKQTEKKSLQAQKKKLSFLQPVQYYQISQKITTLTEDIEELLSQKERLICDNYFHNESEIKTSEIALKNQKDFLKKLDAQYDNLSDQLTENQKKYQEIKADVSPEKSAELFDARVDERDMIRDQVYQKLYATMGQKFDASLFHESVSDIDDRLGEDPEAFHDRTYQKRIAREMERRKEQPVRLKKKVHNHER